MGVMKYRLKLTSLQIKNLKKFYDHYRFSYNKTVGIINGRNEPVSDFSWISRLGNIEKRAPVSNYYSKFELRNMVVPEASNPFTPWLSETPFQIKAYGVFEAYNRYKTCIKNIQTGNINHFGLRFKKKQKRWTMDIPKDNIYQQDEKSFFLYKESGLLKATEKMKEVKNDCKIHFDGIYYYILVPYQKELKKEQVKNHWCSIDPGSRKFGAIYTPEDQSNFFIGEKASKKLHGLMLKLDNVISLLSKKPNRSLRIRKIYLMNKIKNLQQELHRKLSRFLCENYNTILIPKLTKDNDILKNKKINSKTVRMMSVLGHCKFVELLKTKADEYTDVKIEIVTEEYTSQTCLDCKMRTKTTSEIFKCSNCDFTVDRDILGSINIFLKYFNYL